MRKIVLAVLSNVLMIVMPLLGKPALMLHYKIFILIIAGVLIWLTQPAVSVQETSEEKNSDKFSVILILSMSLVSVVAPVIEWGYFHDSTGSFTVYTVIGLLMIATGVGFRAWAVKTLGEFFTATVQIKDDHKLVTKGPYSIVRHPSYTGAFLSIIGCAVLLESWIGFVIASIAMTIAYYVRISIEENELSAHFGTAYKEYKRRTKRIIPFVW
jgi:protein-S-isoprenylcysteine O-methyltransferase Ste14